MKVRITRVDIVHVEPVPGTGWVVKPPSAQVGPFRGALAETVLHEDDLTRQTSDGEFAYITLDHVTLIVELLPDTLED